MTALELWCFSCIIFTFGSLLSYVIILLSWHNWFQQEVYFPHRNLVFYTAGVVLVGGWGPHN